MLRLFLCFTLLLAAPAVLAQTALLPSDVSVDVTGDNVADARTQAMADAPEKALDALLNNLASSRRQEILSTMDAQKISGMVRSIEVLDEQIASNRYRATLRVNFDALAINKLIGAQEDANGVPAVAGRSSALLVLPVFEERSVEQLWEKNNPWLAAWKRVGIETGNGALIVPFGDAQDASQFTAKNVQTGSYESFAPLLGRYGTAEVIVLRASYTEKPLPQLSITRRLVGANRHDFDSFDYRADPGEDRDALLLRAARDLAVQLGLQRQELMTERAMEKGDVGKQLLIMPIGTLPAWVEMRKKMLNLPVVTKVELRAIAANQADMFVYYKGTADALESALRAANFRVQKTDKYWIVAP